MNQDWNTTPLPELIEHIVATHHAYCRREMASLLEQLHTAPVPAALRVDFQQMCAALAQHLAKEELVLFPLIARFEVARREHTPPPRPSFGSVAAPIRMMVLEHGEAEKMLAGMRAETGGFTPPTGASAAVQTAYAGLRAFDEDMKRHVQLEDEYLFPRAVALEQELLGR
ncbi:MAG: hemerythrin domain-containing protein [Terriglobales bacterium]